MLAIFQPQIAKKQGTLRQDNSNLQCPYTRLFQDSDKGVDLELTLSESILHQTIIIFIICATFVAT